MEEKSTIEEKKAIEEKKTRNENAYERAGKPTTPAEIASDFMDAVGARATEAYARRKNITQRQRPLLLEMARESVETYLKTGSWAMDLSDGVLARKGDDGKYEATPELETSRMTIVIPFGLMRELETGVDRMMSARKIRRSGVVAVEVAAKSVARVEGEEKSLFDKEFDAVGAVNAATEAFDKDVKRGKPLTAADVDRVAEIVARRTAPMPTPATPAQMRDLEKADGFVKAEGADV